MPYEPSPNVLRDPQGLLRELASRVDSLYSSSLAPQWQLPRPAFSAAIERSVCKQFAEGSISRERLETYLDTLHAEDLALACACMEGSEPAWDHFVRTYRGYLRASAATIAKGSPGAADAKELADSLFAELFGLVDGKRGQASLFRYFHGRSSLKTWLRAILAQRYIDRVRQSRRWESIDQQDGEGKMLIPPQNDGTSTPDPHRNIYIQRFRDALSASLAALPHEDRQRLELYYARQKTFAEIGRILGEHESSASRNLERVRRDLRAKVEDSLRTSQCLGDGFRKFQPLDDAQIALCFQYALEDVPIDFREIFPQKSSPDSVPGRKGSS